MIGIDKDPKKGGAGGKFTWGDDKDTKEVEIDPKDVSVYFIASSIAILR